MRRLFFILILTVGAVIGLLPAIFGDGDWAAGLVMMCFGLVFAAPVAALLTGIGRRGRHTKWRSNAWGPGEKPDTPFQGDVPIRRWDR